MQTWQHESIFTEFVASEDVLAIAFRVHQRRPSVNPSDRAIILQNTAFALQRLQATLVGNDIELHYTGQLLVYIQQLQNTEPAQSPDDQFNYLYQLRKWLFWIPVALLQRQSGQGPALLSLAHFYATALSLEPLFPDLGSSFCAATALPPLEAITTVTNAMQSSHGASTSAREIASSMQYPTQTAMEYRARVVHLPSTPIQSAQAALGLTPEVVNYNSMGNLSPAFAPIVPHFLPSQPSSASATPFLEVPTDQSFTFGTQNWGAVPSPRFPPQYGYNSPEEQTYGFTGTKTK
ncbi:hypothetical protein LTR86_006301 [Recurvomyces mirabilis]|nr:hypothetical protein LTR86_006301 [Recurvomyces mirabilis]